MKTILQVVFITIGLLKFGHLTFYLINIHAVGALSTTVLLLGILKVLAFLILCVFAAATLGGYHMISKKVWRYILIVLASTLLAVEALNLTLANTPSNPFAYGNIQNFLGTGSDELALIAIAFLAIYMLGKTQNNQSDNNIQNVLSERGQS